MLHRLCEFNGRAGKLSHLGVLLPGEALIHVSAVTKPPNGLEIGMALKTISAMPGPGPALNGVT